MMLDAHRSGRIRAAIGRFSDYYGPHGVNSGLYVTSISAGIKGRTMRGLVDLDQPHTYHYLPDAARGFAELVERPDADGRVWLLPAAPPITQRDLLALINAALPRPVKIGTVTPLMLRLAGPFNPMIRETRSVAVQFDRPWEVDASRFVAELGPIELTPHERAVAETMAFFRSTQQAAAA